MTQTNTRTAWVDGSCQSCGRETRVVHVDGYGNNCIVCLDKLATDGEENAQEVFDQ